MKNCGTCKFFAAAEAPTLLRLEQEWIWGGTCKWAGPLPAAAVMCGVYAGQGKTCPLWEEGEDDYLAKTPSPVHMV